MLRSRTLVGVGLVCALFLAGCSQPQDRPFQTVIATTTPQPAPGYPAPAAPAAGYPTPASPAAGYPGPAPAPTVGPSDPSLEGRDVSALESYKVAAEFALKELNATEFYGIIPSHIMLRNLGNPPVEEGWFFKFKSPDDPAFHFVQVVDGRVNGARSLTPLGEDEPQQQIDMSKVTIDSPAIFERFRARAPELGITYSNAIIYDLELVYLPGKPAPIWSVVTPQGSQWLYSLNAVTGEETTDPRK